MIDTINEPIRMFDAIVGNALANVIAFCIIEDRQKKVDVHVASYKHFNANIFRAPKGIVQYDCR